MNMLIAGDMLNLLYINRKFARERDFEYEILKENNPHQFFKPLRLNSNLTENYLIWNSAMNTIIVFEVIL